MIFQLDRLPQTGYLVDMSYLGDTCQLYLIINSFYEFLRALSFLHLEKVENLRQMFPDVPTAEVERILQDVNGSMDEAASVIILRNSSGLWSVHVHVVLIL